MKLIAWILPVILLSVQVLAEELSPTSQTMTEDEGCLSQELVNDIKNDFIFTNNRAFKNFFLERCNSKHVTNRVLRGLAFLKYGRFSASSKSSDEMFFNSFAGVSPYEFLRSRIKEITFDNCYNPNMVAYAYKRTNYFVVCVDTFEKFKDQGFLPGWFFASTAVHESRHTDIDDIGHFTCTRGELKGMSASCDYDRSQHGAYHYGVDYMAYLSRFGKNFHPAIRANARADAISQLLNHFINIPKIKTSQHVLLREQKEGRLLDLFADQPLQDLGLFTPEKIFSRLGGDVIGYESVSKKFYGWSYGLGAVAPMGGYAISYNQDIGTRAPVIDYLAGNFSENLVAGMIVGQTLKYAIYNMSQKLVAEDSIVLPFQGAQRLLKPAFCQGSIDHTYILTKDQIVYEGALDNRGKMQFKQTINCETGFLNVVQWNNRQLALSTQGQLLELKEKSWIPVANTVGKVFDFISESFDVYDFFSSTGN